MTKTSDKKAATQLYTDAEAKRKELEEKYKSHIKMAVLSAGNDETPCVVYFRTATTFTKMQCMDLSMQSPMKASAMLFDATVMRDVSDARVFERDNDNDLYYLGALDYCLEAIVVARDVLKKKVAAYYQDFQDSETLKRAALIRFYFHVDADSLPPERIEQLWIQLCYCLERLNGREE